jgi:aminopeptidase N
VPSLLRGFSAPVKLVVQGQTDDHLRLMFAHDSDPFNRWAGKRCCKSVHGFSVGYSRSGLVSVAL